MKRLVVYGFHKEFIRPAVERLENEGVCEIVRWYHGDPNRKSCENNICQWHHGRFPKQSEFVAEWPNRDLHFGTASPESMFADQISRHPCAIDRNLADIHDLRNILRNTFGRQLADAKADVVLFQNLPHEGFELVLYEMAMRLGIRTILLHQSIIANRFFYCERLDDFGDFLDVPPDPELPPVQVPRQFQKDLFYMKSVAANPVSLHQRLKNFTTTRKAKIKRWIRAAKQASGYYKLRGKRVHPVHPEREFELTNLELADRNPDFSRPFVYFPLHLQPELTTSMLGGRYADQLLAIEDLRRTLPDDVWIYVKENPKQSFKQRGPLFYRRLKSIPKTRLVNRAVDTYQLMEHSQFVATITGTAGWEAITGGKPALVFGNAWYKNLPGVRTFSTFKLNPDWPSPTIDHNELECELNRLLQKSRLGVLDSVYSQMVPGLDPLKNQNHLFDFLASTLTHNEKKQCA